MATSNQKSVEFDSLSFEREKYIRIAKEEGAQVAITRLHHDLEKIEQECFEGRDGYNPKVWEQLKEFRNFSRELWLIYRKQEEANSGYQKG